MFTGPVAPKNMNKVLLCFFYIYIIVFVDSFDIVTHILQGYFTGTGAILSLSQRQWGNPE